MVNSFHFMNVKNQKLLQRREYLTNFFSDFFIPHHHFLFLLFYFILLFFFILRKLHSQQFSKNQCNMAPPHQSRAFVNIFKLHTQPYIQYTNQIYTHFFVICSFIATQDKSNNKGELLKIKFI